MIHRQSLAEQTASQLIADLRAGRWRGEMPGVDRLAVELGVSRETLRAALAMVEAQGLVTARGGGRSRVITLHQEAVDAARRLRVAIFLHDRFEDEACHTQNLLLQICHDLEKAGHVCFFASKCQMELGQQASRMIRLVEKTEADAWVVVSGSLELLEWFAKGQLPVIAIGGRMKFLTMAGASRDLISTYRSVYRQLIEMGHRRICMISPRERRIPGLSAIEAAFKEEMLASGIPFGPFNAPDWEPSVEGLNALLTSLFQVTPPTLLIVSSPGWMVGVISFLNRNGFKIPEDVSLICEFMDNTLVWHRPEIAHFTCDYGLIQRRVVRWVDHVAKGKSDLKKVSSPAVFESGASLLPPRL